MNSIESSLGKTAGVVSERRWSAFTKVRDEMVRIIDMLQGYTLSPQAGHFLSRIHAADKMITRSSGLVSERI
jgi:hypothetical protein